MNRKFDYAAWVCFHPLVGAARTSKHLIVGKTCLVGAIEGQSLAIWDLAQDIVAFSLNGELPRLRME